MGIVKEELSLEAAICDIDDMANVCVMLVDILEKNERSAANMKMRQKQAAERIWLTGTTLFRSRSRI
jgi:hypothetical protein